MVKLLSIPTIATIFSLSLLTSCSSVPEATVKAKKSNALEIKNPYSAQVVGLQWLNPLQRKDYPTEWQLLWTMEFVKPNNDDEMAIADPREFTSPSQFLLLPMETMEKKPSKVFSKIYK